MSTYVIPGGDPVSICRRRVMQALTRREGYLAQVTDQGPDTCGDTMRQYLDNISKPDSSYCMFKLREVAQGIGINELQARILARRLGVEADLYCMADALRMQQELAREPEGVR